MYERLIEKYINNLDIDSIISYGKKQGINVTQNDAQIIYDTIINKWRYILHNDPTNIFNDLKTKLEKDTYNKMIELYKKYKIYL